MFNSLYYDLLEENASIPRNLKKGDNVEVLVLSAPDGYNNKDEFKRGVKYLERLGLIVKYRDEVFNNSNGYLIAPPKEQARWIESAFADKDISAIFLANGGSNLNRVIQYIDFDIIKKNPKIVMGMSNMTILLNAITIMTGLVTYHGPAVIFNMGQKSGLDKYSEESFLSAIFTNRKVIFKPYSKWKSLPSRNRKATGMILGGNLTTLESLLGTKFEPDWNKVIFFWEDCFMELHELDMILSHFELAGVFRKIKGIVIGRPLEIREEEYKTSMTFEKLIKDFFKDYDIPILYNVDFGHNNKKMVLPLGKIVKIDADKLSITEV